MRHLNARRRRSPSSVFAVSTSSRPFAGVSHSSTCWPASQRNAEGRCASASPGFSNCPTSYHGIGQTRSVSMWQPTLGWASAACVSGGAPISGNPLCADSAGFRGLAVLFCHPVHEFPVFWEPLSRVIMAEIVIERCHSDLACLHHAGSRHRPCSPISTFGLAAHARRIARSFVTAMVRRAHCMSPDTDIAEAPSHQLQTLRHTAIYAPHRLYAIDARAGGMLRRVGCQW
jgi:hypothetical protein